MSAYENDRQEYGGEGSDEEEVGGVRREEGILPPSQDQWCSRFSSRSQHSEHWTDAGVAAVVGCGTASMKIQTWLCRLVLENWKRERKRAGYLPRDHR